MTLQSMIVKRVAFGGVLCLLMLLPATTWAASSTCFTGFVCIDNAGGMAIGGTTGLVMDGSFGSSSSSLVTISGQSVSGTLSINTGILFGGSFGTGICSLPPCTVGYFGAGTLSINVTNYNGFSGTLFQGTFGDPNNGIAWEFTGTLGTGANKVYQYELIGPVSGTWEGGGTLSGQSAQLYFTTKTPYKGGSINLTSGTTSLLTPEPASIGLLGTGLLALGVLVRRKAKREV
jgi:hypothetical protein